MLGVLYEIMQKQREIRFRTWDNKEKKFGYLTIHPQSISWPDPTYFLQRTLEDHNDDICGVSFPNIGDWQQMTGLKDKNGKDVYEGDIVSLGRNVNQRRVIGWWEDTHGWGYVYPTGEQFQQFRYYQTGFMKDKMEIIGNIYESPDFLK